MADRILISRSRTCAAVGARNVPCIMREVNPARILRCNIVDITRMAALFRISVLGREFSLPELESKLFSGFYDALTSGCVAGESANEWPHLRFK